MNFVAIRNVLFVCGENAGRSQMAEALFNRLASARFRASSAGTRPAGHLNPVIVQAMKERGIVLSGSPKILTAQILGNADMIVGMGCTDMKSCTAPSSITTLDWQIPDPRGKKLEEVRVIRDMVETKVRELAADLGD